MAKVKTMGASPMTGTIYQGTLDTDRNMWVGKKVDVTDMACRAVAEHLHITDRNMAFGLASGGFLVVTVQKVDQLPAAFEEAREGDK
ncbi:hypothetical protein ACK34W_17400 [Aeromonas veronii]